MDKALANFTTIITTSPHDKTKTTNLELRFTLTETTEKRSLSIYSTNLYRGVIILIVGNQWMDWSDREGWWQVSWIHMHIVLDGP